MLTIPQMSIWGLVVLVETKRKEQLTPLTGDLEGATCSYKAMTNNLGQE